ncbi:uncharacterized protein J3D65DRAFT_694490 [Phyllosticta citribraziliensis]|uniref:Uncharacterized protein n=1 Tax=Phyllosticta citribraziliensis TaxID=989973 RepID=A0ABR1LX12_9PEZI
MIYVIYHHIDGDDIDKLIGIHRRATFKTLWLSQKTYGGVRTLQCQILKWVKLRVAEIYQASKKAGAKMEALTSAQRIERYWTPFLRNNPPKSAKKPHRPDFDPTLGVAIRHANCDPLLSSQQPGRLQPSQIMGSTPPSTPKSRPFSHGAPSSNKRKREDLELEVKSPETDAGGLAEDREIKLAGQSGVLDDVLGYLVPGNTDKPNEKGSTTTTREKVQIVRAMLFFVTHEVDPADMIKLLRDRDMWSKDMELEAVSWAGTVSNWQNRTLNFVSDSIQAVVKQRETELPKMTGKDRSQVWATEYRKNPIRYAQKMWGAVGAVVKWDVIFDPPATCSKEMKDLMQTWRTYLIRCYVYAAENSYVFRHLYKIDPEALLEHKMAGEDEYSLWRGARLTEAINPPSIKDIPIPSEFAPARKKRRAVKPAKIAKPGKDLNEAIEGIIG